MFEDVQELHGDRPSPTTRIVCGIARFNVAAWPHRSPEGRNTKDNLVRNFGMPRPEGYRKALRIMELPSVSFAHHHLHRYAGAYPGIDAKSADRARPSRAT